jgi:hypothetical protein
VRAICNTSVWLQAGQYLALAAQIPAKQKSGCPRLLSAVVLTNMEVEANGGDKTAQPREN